MTPAQFGHFKPRADRDGEIATGPELCPACDRQAQGMRIADDPPPGAKGHDRRLDRLGERGHLVACVQRAAANEDHRHSRDGDQRHSPVERVRIRSRRRKWRKRRKRWNRCAGGKEVPRCLQRDGALSSRQHFLESARDEQRRLGRMLDPLCPFDHRAQHAKLIAHLVQLTALAAEIVGRHLAGQTQ